MKPIIDKLKVAKSRVVIGRKYQHYKGGMYRVSDIVMYEKTAEPFVIYYKIKDGAVAEGERISWARSLDDFCSFANEDDKMPRFTRMD